MSMLKQGGASVGTTSTDIIKAADYQYNLFLCANPNNTDTIRVTLSAPEFGAVVTDAVVGEAIPLSKGGSLNLTKELGIIGCTVSAIAQSGSQRISWLMI